MLNYSETRYKNCYGRYIFIEKKCQCRYNDSENGIGYVVIRDGVIFVLDIPAKKIDVSVGMKFGCLQILDEGAEYLQVMDERISNIKEEKAEFVTSMEEGEYTHQDRFRVNDGASIRIPAFVYQPINFEVYGNSVAVSEFDEAIAKLLRDKEITHYKCKCRKCGKIRYYSEETLRTEPKFCYKPLYCSSKFTYSTRSYNANYNKRKKYEKNESVCLVDDRDTVIPAEEYCNAWNDMRKKDLVKKAEKDAQIITAIPRRYANNYDIDYVGLKYESLEVLECVDDALESPPIPYYTQRHQKKYRDIIVYKQYRCKCYLCGNEKLVTCDQFGIYPPTKYGYRAYDGYWSKVSCNCHPISSFQWIVNDILIKNGINYKVEVEAEGVYGIDNETPLRFDFGVYKKERLVALIECQGEQHFMPVVKFGGERRFAIQQRNDEEKRKYAKDKNIKLIEISYKKKKYEIVEALLKEHHII